MPDALTKAKDQRRHFKFAEEMAFDDTNGIVEGYLSVFGNDDSYGDVVQPGAFKRTIKNWTASKRNIPLLWQHKGDEPIGHILEIREDAVGVWIKARIVLDEGCDLGKRAYALLKSRSIDGLSFQYDIIRAVPNTTHGLDLQEVKLNEGSVVTFPANTLATVLHVKSSLPVTDWPIAPADTVWSSGAAKRRCVAWAGDDTAKLKSCFLVYDPEQPDSLADYRLGYVDIIDGAPQVVPAALKSLHGVELPEAEQATLKATIATLVRRVTAEEETPMPSKEMTTGGPRKALASRMQAEVDERALYDERWKWEDAFRSTLYEIFEDENITPEQMIEEATEAITDYTAFMQEWVVRRAKVEADEDARDAVRAKGVEFHARVKSAAPDSRKGATACLKGALKAMSHMKAQLDMLGYDTDCDADMAEDEPGEEAKSYAELMSTVPQAQKAAARLAVKAHKSLCGVKAAAAGMVDSMKTLTTDPNPQNPGALFQPSGTQPTAVATPDPLSNPADATHSEEGDLSDDAATRLLEAIAAAGTQITNVAI